MAKTNFVEVIREKNTHIFPSPIHGSITLEVELKADSKTTGTVTIYRPIVKQFLFFKWKKLEVVDVYSIEKLINQLKRENYAEFSYNTHVTYWADIISAAWKKTIDKEEARRMKDYEYRIRVREAKTVSLA